MDKKIPNHEEVKQIFNDTYNKFYLKWKDIQTEEDFLLMLDEIREIDKKHNCDLCRNILFDLSKVIENQYMSKGKVDNE